MLAIVAPVPVENVELGRVEGRSRDDETAAFIMTVLLFMAIATYGAMVLSGVVEEKASRVVEVLLARMPARSLLAGKIAGIGLLGLGQIVLTAVVALGAVAVTDSFDVPAVRGAVLAWVIVWFVLGYALYATVFGALGSLASRPEDAQSVAGPVSAVLIAGYFASFAAIGSPDTVWAKLVSYFPATAPLAMPNRIAMGAAAWWEPLIAIALTTAVIAGLVQLGGRVYTGGVLHTGATLKLRDAWRSTTPQFDAPPPTGAREVVRGEHGGRRSTDDRRTDRSTSGALIAAALAIAAVIYLFTRDAVIGIAAGTVFFAVARRIVKPRAARAPQHYTRRP
jgi:ABC-2 type transport system permease protein